MRPFLKDLTGEQKEDFKALFECKGLQALLEWLVFTQAATKEAISLDAKNMEEVEHHRGRLLGFKEVVKFLGDCKRDLKNYKGEE